MVFVYLVQYYCYQVIINGSSNRYQKIHKHTYTGTYSDPRLGWAAIDKCGRPNLIANKTLNSSSLKLVDDDLSTAFVK